MKRPPTSLPDIARLAEHAFVSDAPLPTRTWKKERDETWHRASAETRFWKANVELLDASAYFRLTRGDTAVRSVEREEIWAERADCVSRLRAAIARQLLTPASLKSHIAWKRNARRDQHLPISPEAIDAAIERDVAAFRCRGGSRA